VSFSKFSNSSAFAGFDNSKKWLRFQMFFKSLADSNWCRFKIPWTFSFVFLTAFSV
jgi:hypothetical protein